MSRESPTEGDVGILREGNNDVYIAGWLVLAVDGPHKRDVQFRWWCVCLCGVLSYVMDTIKLQICLS